MGLWSHVAHVLSSTWMYISSSFHRSDDAIQLRCLLSLFQAQVRVREGISLFLPYTDQVDALQLNSLNISHHIISLKPPGSLSHPCQHKGPFFSRQLLDFIFVCTHHSQFHIEITCHVEVLGSSPTSFSKYFKDARDAGLVHLQTFAWVWRAYAAITIAVPKRIAVHLSSNFHDLFLCKTVLKPTTLRTQICYCNTYIEADPDCAHPKTWSLERKGGQESAHKREQVLGVFPL